MPPRKVTAAFDADIQGSVCRFLILTERRASSEPLRVPTAFLYVISATSASLGEKAFKSLTAETQRTLRWRRELQIKHRRVPGGG